MRLSPSILPFAALTAAMLSKALGPLPYRRLLSSCRPRSFSSSVWSNVAGEAGEGAPMQAHDVAFYQQFDVPLLGKYHNFYPENTPSFNLMERCVDEAHARGAELAASYEPYLPVDLMQSLIITRNTMQYKGKELLRHLSALKNVSFMPRKGKFTSAEKGRYLLQYLIHDYIPGHSWMASIAVAATVVRIMVLPLLISSMRAGRVKQRIMPQMDALTAEMKEAEKKGSQQQLIRAQTKYSQFIKEHGSMVTMKGMLGMFVQIPIFTTAFMAMRQMSNHPHIFKGFPMETPLWLDSLALSDPIIVLPVLASALLLTNIEFFGSIDSAQAGEAGDRPDTKNKLGIDSKTMQKYSRHGFRALCVIALPATMYLPAGLFVYTCTNAMWAITQNRVLRLPIVEQALNIPHNIKKEEKKDETYFDPGSIVTVEEALRISKENSQRAEQVARMSLQQKVARRAAQAAVEASLPQMVSMKRKQK